MDRPDGRHHEGHRIYQRLQQDESRPDRYSKPLQALVAAVLQQSSVSGDVRFRTEPSPSPRPSRHQTVVGDLSPLSSASAAPTAETKLTPTRMTELSSRMTTFE